MPFLTVPTFGNVPVAMESGASSKTWDEVGGRSRAFNGDMHSTVRARKRSWRFRTRLMLRASADSLISALEGTAPLACSGDALGGAVNCHYEPVSADDTALQPGLHQVVEFILHEE
jgi:hypothetical protein